MASQAAADRVSALLSTANELIVNQGQYAKASEILREASHLEPANVKVQEAWKLLQSKSTTRDAIESIRNYIGSRQDDYGKKALQDLKESRQLGPHEASEAVNLLLHSDSDPGRLLLSDSILSTLIIGQLEVRKQLASNITSSATDIYNQVYDKGEASFGAFASLTTDETLWASKAVQIEAQRDIFRLSIASLIAAGIESPE